MFLGEVKDELDFINRGELASVGKIRGWTKTLPKGRSHKQGQGTLIHPAEPLSTFILRRERKQFNI